MKLRRIVTPIVMLALLLIAAAAVRLSAPAHAVPPAVAAPPADVAASAASSTGQRLTLPPLQAGAVPALAASSSLSEMIAGGILTQTFSLQPGWNSVYLGVEPINPSPLVNEGTADKPVWVHEKSTMEAVFVALAATGSLESVWTYNQPAAHKDYIVDPGEGLWDAPGWLRYIPNEATGADGQSQGFLTNLVSLHANTGYLVKLKDGAAAASFVVYGKPVPGHQRWAPGAYNLSGFPVTPQGAPVDAFLAAAGGSITEIRRLTTDGKWSLPLVAGDSLAEGVAYLVRYADEPILPDYAAPLDLANGAAGAVLSDGLSFKAGLGGQSLDLLVKNTSTATTTVSLMLPEGNASAVALQYIAHSENGDTAVNLQDGPALFDIGPGSGQHVELRVPATLQKSGGEALLEVSAAGLGTRWLIPVTAHAGSYAGLWVGDVVVNDVSEARLGSTDFAHDLTVALQPVNSSGVRGAAQVHEVVNAGVSTLAFTVSLTLPSLPSAEVALTVPDPTYKYGWVFVDLDQNGQHDAGEPGLPSARVMFSGESAVDTEADGSFVKQLSAGSYDVTVGGVATNGYTTAFSVTLPMTATGNLEQPVTPVVMDNQVPTAIVLEATGLASVTPPEYLSQVIGQATLPYYDLTENRVEPPLNFAYVRLDVAEVYERTCDAPGDKLFDLGNVINGQLVVTVPDTQLSDLVGHANVRVGWKGETVACANLVIGSPTQFADGRGSQAKFRVVLRVSDTGQTALLPFYAMDEKQRVSSAIFLSLQQPMTITGPFGTSGAGLEYNLTLPANDPLNPYKHKYHPDHDNLDAKFQGYQEESFDIQRKVTFILTDLPYQGDAASAAALDWGGVVWGGDYREVVDNLYKNTITARGYFVIRHVLTGDQLVKQEYDK